MHLCDKITIQFLFQSIEGWALIRGVGAYLRGRLFDITVSRVGAYLRGACLFKGALSRDIMVIHTFVECIENMPLDLV